MPTAASLREQLHEDWITHNRRTLLPGLHALVVHRVAVWCRSQPAPVRVPLAIVCRLLNNLLIRNVYGVE
ncbi:MAG: serine acetyltransferase, partial [Actinobacteria bacterium]|nr:serine acetyltransferase [Actinomycetota bacterium]